MRTATKRLIVKALEREAKRILRRHKPKIIAVAGSVGKTSTKLYTAEVLRQKYKVLAHTGSYNTDLGVPLSILNLATPARLFNPAAWVALLAKAKGRYLLSYPFDVVVVELGTDKPGDISYLMRYIKPAVGIITAVTPEHMEGFGTMEAVLNEEFALAKGSQHALLNAGDVLLDMKKRELKGKTATFGVGKGDYWFDITGKNKSGHLKGNLHLGKRNLAIQLKLVAEHAAIGAVAAAAVADIMGLNDQQIKTALENIKPVSGRMNPLPGKNGSIIIDDTYNSSPDAASAALNTLYSFPAKRRLAIMGSMNELGDYSKEGHEIVGRFCNKLQYLVTVGNESKRHLVQAAIDAGLSKNNVKSFVSPYDAGRFVAKLLKPGDVLLAKGSQNGIFIEEAIKLVLANPSDSSSLVRQTPFWLRRKAQQFPKQ